MALGNEATARVNDTPPAVGEIVAVNSFTSLTFFAKAKKLIRDQLITAEAVVELNNVDILRSDSCHFVGLFGGIFGHRPSDQVDHRTIKSVGLICGQTEACDLNGLVLKTMLDNEVF